MASDRDVRKPKTPPAGVRAQTAPPEGESAAPQTWEGEDTGNTPVGEETLSTMNRRVKETKTAATDTLASVSALRTEMASNVQRMDTRLGVVEANMQRVENKVSSIDMKFDQLSTKVVEVFASAVEQQQERQTISFEAHVDVNKRAQIAAIEDQKDTRKFAREQRLKMMWLVGKVLGLLASGGAVTYLLSRCD